MENLFNLNNEFDITFEEIFYFQQGAILFTSWFDLRSEKDFYNFIIGIFS
ncbi:hypothetical protein NEF87_003508 [Candidatus Lokiarchaeum ossiferum]|uniref:Uncharacterized protein n=1 Tax=Candidatus Lokiarchaeum ossiferum TaxID=2951803 RepID=A0ABY6HV45_9ARCH|nr:hypothetical protein NEF87_003508 [Candidatus Lokiarchaeum sp. B-35]